jgi:pimeloyl-ACP methyl ester carboxylesterase
MVFVVRAAERPGDRPPVLALAGAGSGSVRWATSAFGPPYPVERDVIFVDTRGKDGSGLALCDSTRRAQASALARDLEGEALRTAFFAPLRACRQELEAANAPPDVYGTARIVQDLEQLRMALGHPRLLLFGASHGTVIANSYAAAYPDRVEALLLDGAYPPDPTPATLTATFREGLKGAAAACRQSTLCGSAGADLEAAFERAVASLRRAPLLLDTQSLGRMVLNADDFTLMVQNALYPGVNQPVMPEVTPQALAPALIMAVEARDAALAGRLADGPLSRLVAGPHSAVFVSGECADRTRYFDRRPEPFTGVELIDLSTVCPSWAERPRTPARIPEGRSPPALIITGSTDPITPVRFAQDTARRLGPNARVLVVNGAGHGTVRSTPCGRAAAQAFFSDPASSASISAC